MCLESYIYQKYTGEVVLCLAWEGVGQCGTFRDNGSVRRQVHDQARDALLQSRSCMVQESLTRSLGYLVFIGAIADLESDKYSGLLEECVGGGTESTCHY